MTLTLKIMSDENMPDDDACKSFSLIQIKGDVRFVRLNGEAYAVAVPMWAGDSEIHTLLPGNCYVLNEGGKTIASFLRG